MREPEREGQAAKPEERASAGDDERARETDAAHEQSDADDAVTVASEGSFPASDPPPWTSSATRGA